MVGRRRNLEQEKEKLCCNEEGKAGKTLLGLVRVAAHGQGLVVCTVWISAAKYSFLVWFH